MISGEITTCSSQESHRSRGNQSPSSCPSGNGGSRKEITYRKVALLPVSREVPHRWVLTAWWLFEGLFELLQCLLSLTSCGTGLVSSAHAATWQVQEAVLASFWWHSDGGKRSNSMIVFFLVAPRRKKNRNTKGRVRRDISFISKKIQVGKVLY